MMGGLGEMVDMGQQLAETFRCHVLLAIEVSDGGILLVVIFPQ